MAGHLGYRVKSVTVVNVLNQHLVVSISSDGKINVYPLPIRKSTTSTNTSTQEQVGIPVNPKEGEEEDIQSIHPISSFDTKGSRLTCLSVVAVSGDRTTAASVTANGFSDGESESGDSESDDLESEVDVIGANGLEATDTEQVGKQENGIEGKETEDESEDDTEDGEANGNDTE